MNTQVYYNGKIFTSDGKKTAEAFVIEDGKFIYVGNNETAKTYGDGIDLKEKTVLPGLVDSHCHIVGGYESVNMDMISLDADEVTPENLNTILLEACKEYEIDLKTTKKINAYGYYLTNGDFSKKCIGTEFDNIGVFIFSTDGHSILANDKAFELAGITKDTKDPSGSSYFERDEEGNLTGLVVEIQAMKMLSKFFRDESNEGFLEKVSESVNICNSFGITACFDAYTTENLESEWVYESLQKADLNMHIVTSHLYEYESDAEDILSTMKYFRSKYGSKNIYPNILKIIYDGVIESHTAYLSEPYEDETDECGESFFSREEIKDITEEAIREGFDVHVHAIGNQATRDIAEVFAETPKTVRKTMAHCQLIDDETFELLRGREDVYFQTTPQWIREDEYTKQFLGEKRFENQFKIGTAIKNGLCVAFGSDSVNEELMLNPFVGMYYAVIRGEKGTFPPKSEAIGIEDAVLAYTANGAKLLGIDGITGKIKDNLSADFVIIDRDIFSIPAEMIKDTKVEKTFFKGSCIYDAAL